MERVPEPELMEEEEQVRAYAEADFEEPHNRFIEIFSQHFDGEVTGHVLDLGCGPGDISFRFARRYPSTIVHGIDGSAPMLAYGRKHRPAALKSRVGFWQGRLPVASLPRRRYDVIISNSLLHHLPDPQVLWESIKGYGAEATKVFVMDLRRPCSDDKAKALVAAYAAGEPAILQRDFYQSLLAAFEPGEVRRQLRAAGLGHMTLEEVGDRHMIVYGIL